MQPRGGYRRRCCALPAEDTRSRFEYSSKRIEARSVRRVRTIDPTCDLECSVCKRAIAPDELGLAPQCFEVTLNRRRVAASNGAGETTCRTSCADVAQCAFSERHECAHRKRRRDAG